MKLLIWIALFSTLLPAEGIAGKPCSNLLNQPRLSQETLRETSTEILSHLRDRGPLFESIQIQVYSILTGLHPSLLEGERKQDQLIHRLQPIQRWKRVIGRTHWDGRSYVKTKSKGKEVHYNSFWGRPFNINPFEPVAVNINHSPHNKSSWINLSLGWTEISDQELQQLNEKLTGIFPELRLYKLPLLEVQESTPEVLVLTGLNQHPDHLNFLDGMVDRLQDRYFHSDAELSPDPAE